MLTRLLSTLVLAPVFLAVTWYGDPYFKWSVALLAVIAGAELLKISGDTGRPVLHVAALAFLFLSLTALIVNQAFFAGAAVLLAAAIAWSTSRREVANRFWGSMGLIYIFICTLAIFEIRAWTPAGREWVLWFFAVVWAADIGAYIVGKNIGGVKLCPAISPGKTWSGAAGGLAIAIITSLILSRVFLPEQGILEMMFLGAITCVASQIGDLLESYFKRVNAVKDSGRLIPGHGGILDRIDGVLLAAPVTFLFVPHLTKAVI
ncbi:MAG: phosphatidate cytidylyltransferase [Rhodospirillaceae bacterium]|nr:phosphatidate cytidylyltransferase [Rhodospirillaceae bacterium]